MSILSILTEKTVNFLPNNHNILDQEKINL